jgi:hypothetical protein
VSAPQASRSDRKHCLRHSEVIARLLKQENPGHIVAGVLFESRARFELAADEAWVNYRWLRSSVVRGRTAETGRGRQRIDIRGRHKSLW